MEKTIQFGEDFEPVEIAIDAQKQSDTNQIYINDLIKLKETLTVAPTTGTGTKTDFVPKKFIDQIQFVYVGGVYSLYIYVNNSWKSVNLT